MKKLKLKKCECGHELTKEKCRIIKRYHYDYQCENCGATYKANEVEIKEDKNEN